MRHATGLRSTVLGAAAFLLMMAYYGMSEDAPAALAIAAAVAGVAAAVVGVLAFFRPTPPAGELQKVTVGALLGLMSTIPLLHLLIALLAAQPANSR